MIEGQVIETGVGFSLTYEYNRFKELFAKKSKQDKAREKRYKEEQKEKKKQQKESDKRADDAVAQTQSADIPENTTKQ